MAKDYYQILGVAKGTSKEDIKKAYKKLAKQYHPDINKNPSATEKFKEINEAAAVLGDEKRREQYDRFGSTAEGFGGGTGGFDFSDGMDLNDLFHQFFGGGFGGRRRRGPTRGRDLAVELEISLEDAYRGVERPMVLPRLERCDKCEGSGSASGGRETCQDCKGAGVQRIVRRTPFGMVQTQGTCRTCGGEGIILKNPCESCEGEGVVRKSRRINVKIPAGISDESQLRLSGEGEGGERGGHSGDLYVRVHVVPNERFTREGEDLIMEFPITFAQAALGDTVTIETFDEQIKLKIPAEVQTGTTLRVRGKGMPNIRGGQGDLHVKVAVQTPAKLSKNERELLATFAKERGEKLHDGGGFFSKLKKGL